MFSLTRIAVPFRSMQEHTMHVRQERSMHKRGATFRKEPAMKQPLRTLAAVALLAVTLGSTNAFGIDRKNYAGSFCQPATAADSDRVRYSLGTARNSSTTAALFLECPIIKDSIDHPVQGGLVAVVDRRTDDQVSCAIRSMRALDGAAL